MMPAEFHFLRPAWLWLLIPLVVLLWRLLRSSGNSDAWRRVVDPHLLSHLLIDAEGGVRRLPIALLGTGWLLAVMALAGPTWERLPQPVYQAQQYRVILLDISPSMNATDLSPSRLTHARYEILDLLRKSQEGQTALIAYGAEPFVVSPLTSDVATIAAQVPSLETGLLPVRGAKRTDLALKEAGSLLSQAGAPVGQVVVVTDNVDSPGGSIEAAKQLEAQGYHVSVLGIGTTKGAPVPLGNGSFLKDAEGAIRLSKLDQDALRSLAEAGGGIYVGATSDDRDIELLTQKDVTERSLSSSPQSQTQADQWQEEGPWLLVLLLPLAALAFRRGWLSPLLVLIVLMPPQDAQALTWDDLWATPDQQAIRHFEAGQAAQAATQFEQPDWRAAAQYQAGDYEKALETLRNKGAKDAAYNRGNTLARLGRLEDAVDAYDRALADNPDNDDAKHNRELVNKLLQQQKQQQQSQQQSQQQDKEQQGGKGQSQSQPSQNSDQSSKDQQGAPGKQSESDADKQQQNGQQDQAHKGEDGKSQSDEQQAAGKAQEQQDSNDTKPQAGVQQKQDQQPSDAEAQQAQNHDENGADKSGQSQVQQAADQNQQPGLADLINSGQRQRQATAESQTAQVNPEHQQAMEQMLRRVEDDPAGLLRQRFLLQHLRRQGRLP